MKRTIYALAALLAAFVSTPTIVSAADIYNGGLADTSRQITERASLADFDGIVVGGLAGWAEGNFDTDTTLTPAHANHKHHDLNHEASGDSFIGGGFVEGGRQFGNFYLGGVLDFSWLDAEAEDVVFVDGKHEHAHLAEYSLTNFGTARLEAGYQVAPAILVVATGGVAWGNVEGSFSSFHTNDGAINLDSPHDGDGASFDKTKIGWTVGLGVKTKVTENVLAKIEYLYADLGDVDHPVSSKRSGDTDITVNVVRLGVGYQF